MVTIYFYKETEEPYGCFSNFSDHAVFMKGIIWRTAEHYFQAQKFAGAPLEEEVRRCQTPAKAKKFANKHLYPHAWHQVKDGVMLDALRAKFSQHPDLKELLLSTGNALLVENAPRDNYWGAGSDGRGRNQLGKLLMQVRDELRPPAS